MADLFRHLLFFTFLLCIAVACSDDNPPDLPIEETHYFESVGEKKQYLGKELIAKLFGDVPGLSLPAYDNIEINIEVINYKTVDPQGKPVIASGIISYPSSFNWGNIILAEHYTISADYESPSKQMATNESLFALLNNLVISPDYLGFGITSGVRHPYLHTENTAQISLDMLFAVREYMEMKEKTMQKSIYVMGYSQGGAAALAVQKMAEERYTDEVNILSVMAGGGPYDLIAIFDSFAKTNAISYPCSLPMTVIGMDYGDNLKLDYSQIFIEPLLSNYGEWINSKKYSTGNINNKMNSNVISDFLHPDFFTKEMNPEFRKLYNSLAKNSLTDWIPKAPILMVHGLKDEVVPYFCAQNAYDSFIEKGVDIELIPVDSDHKGTAISFYLLMLKELL